MNKLSWCLIGTSYILTSVHNPESLSAHYQRRKVTTNSATSSAAIYDSDLPAWHAGIVVAQSLCSYDWSFCYMRITLGESQCGNTNLGWATKIPQGHYEVSVWCSTKEPWFMLKRNTTDALSVFVLPISVLFHQHLCDLLSSNIVIEIPWATVESWKCNPVHVSS